MKKISVFIVLSFFIICCVLWDRLPDKTVSREEDKKTVINEIRDIDTENISAEIFNDIYKPLNFSRQKAMWFTYMDYEKILAGKSADEFTEEIDKRFTTAAMMGINTVYVQVRGFCDAYYKSELFPPGKYYTDQSFDPLEIMIRKAHSLGLSFHAWINPLRCMTTDELNSIDAAFKFRQWYDSAETKGKVIVQNGDRWYLNPAYPEVSEYICDGICEIIKNYSVDGIHIDDYFYPTTDLLFDKEAFDKSGSADINEWRRDNINKLVKNMYKNVKSVNDNVIFGISPQGNTEVDYQKQYADVEKWLSEGEYCDYIVPQIYYGYLNETCPFSETIIKWKDIAAKGNTSLVIGLCTYKAGSEDKWAGKGKDEWINDTGIISKQVKECIKNNDIDGIAIYSYSSTFEEGVSAEIMVMGPVQEIRESFKVYK